MPSQGVPAQSWSQSTVIRCGQPGLSSQKCIGKDLWVPLPLVETILCTDPCVWLKTACNNAWNTVTSSPPTKWLGRRLRLGECSRLYWRLPFGETPPPPPHLKHHRARAFHTRSQARPSVALGVRYDYHTEGKKKTQRSKVTYPKSQSLRVLGLALWKQAAGSLGSPFCISGFQTVPCRASTCFEGPEN